MNRPVSCFTFLSLVMLIVAGSCFVLVSEANAQQRTSSEQSVMMQLAFVSNSDYEERTLLNTGDDKRALNPAGALLRSFVLPGWGQYYADSNNWRRGQYHLGADIALLGTWIYLSNNASMLQNNMYAHASAYAGINLRNVPLNVELAVGSSNSFDSYNENQLRTRNWDRLLDDRPDFRWNWDTEERRGEYLRMRDRRDRAEQQIPAIATLMVVNRVISGVHAFIVARNQNTMLESAHLGFSLPEVSGGQGVQATLSYRF